MKRRKHLVLVTLAVIGVLLLLAGPVTAQATKAKFTAIAGAITPGTPGRVWFSMQGDMEHIRALPLSRPITGDINGTVSIIHNNNENVVTGEGEGWGKVKVDGTWDGLSGTFEGRYHMTMTGSGAFGELVAHGTGGFEGMKIMASYWTIDPPPFMRWEGIILDPHGE